MRVALLVVMVLMTFPADQQGVAGVRGNVS